MKMIKSLLLGSPAVLIALGGAQAADLPVKAKAVEYVRICSLFGAGFYYIPGTDTCIKLGGYLRVETALNTQRVTTTASSAGVGGAHNRLSQLLHHSFRAKTSTSIPAPRPNTALSAPSSMRCSPGPRAAYTANGATPAGTAYSGAAPVGNPSDGGIAGGSLGVYYAFIQFAGFTMGKTISAVRRALDQLSRQQLRRSRRRRRHVDWRQPVHLHRSSSATACRRRSRRRIRPRIARPTSGTPRVATAAAASSAARTASITSPVPGLPT